MDTIKYQKISSIKEIKEAVSLMKETWGENATSLTQLVAAMNHGGVLISAVSKDQLIGFSYGFPGYLNNEAYLVSQILIIVPHARNSGIGKELKLMQRKYALENGFQKMKWSYDPLESRNAYFNLNKLGGYVSHYYENYYGEMDDELNSGLPSDRFELVWDLNSKKTGNALLGSNTDNPNYPVLLGYNQDSQIITPKLETEESDSEGYLVSIPSNIHNMKLVNKECALQWRLYTRDIFQEKFQQGYVVTSLLYINEHVSQYVLKKHDSI